MGRAWALLVLALTLAVVLALAWESRPGGTGFFQGLEAQALDWMLEVRYQAGAAPRLDPRILLVEIDEATFRTLRKPNVLWEGDLAGVMRALRAAGARVIGLDLMLNPDLGGLPPGHPLVAEVRAGGLDLARVVLEGRTVLIGTLALGEHEAAELPAQRVLWAARSHEPLHSLALTRGPSEYGNLTYNNVITDRDGTVRGVPILATSDGSGTFAFATRLAELAQGQAVRLQGGKATFGEAPVELEDLPTGLVLRLNYPGPTGTFPRVSFATLWRQVRQGQALSGYEGTICILAPAAPSFADFHTTPVSSNYLGAEIQATALNSLLTGRYLHRLPLGAWLAAAGLFALACGAAAFCLPRARGLSVAAALAAAYAAAALLALCRWELWFPLASPLVGGLFSLGVGYVVRYLTVECEQRLVRSLFARMVSPQVMREVMRQPGLIAARRKRLTFLFSDINDFTPACEGNPPEEVIAHLNRYFEEMVHIVFEQGGTVKQFVGDEIMVLFGAPEEQPDHAARAVRTALVMQQRLRQLARSAPEGSWGFYQVKIGIHTGEAVVGHVGSLERAEYAAVGDNVNLAARIEGLAGKLEASILASAVTREEAAPHLEGVEWESFGVQTFKGKTERLELFRPYSQAEGNHGL